MGERKQDTWPEKVRDIATTLDGLLGELDAAVGALKAILPPDTPAPDVVEVPAP